MTMARERKEFLKHRLSVLEEAVRERDAIILGLKRELKEAKAISAEKEKIEKRK